MSGNACPRCGRPHPWCAVEWSADEAADPDRPDDASDDPAQTCGPPYRVGELLPDLLDILARGSRGPDHAKARERPGRTPLRGLIPGPRRRV